MNSKNSLYIKIGLVAGIALGLGAGSYYVLNKAPEAPIITESTTRESTQAAQPKQISKSEEPVAQEVAPVAPAKPATPAVQAAPAEEKPVKPKPQPKPRKKETKLPPLPFLPEPKLPACSHELGFQSLKEQVSEQNLKVQGTIPAWLNGSFISIGPAIFEIGETKALHWLDGLGMVYLFAINGQNVAYSNKIVESTYCKECLAKGKLRGSAPEQKKSTWAKLTSAVSSSSRPTYDNANINVACFNKELVALTETPFPICFDPRTARTTGAFNFDDKIETQFTSAHPLFDPTTQEWYSVGIHFAHNSNYVIYKIGKDSSSRKVVASIPVGYPTYIHSFAMSPQYIIITEAPFTVSPYDLLLSDNAFIENFNWKPKNGTQFIVVDKKTGKKIGCYKTKAFFTLHHVNAFEKDGQLFIDLIAHDNPKVVHSFGYENLCDPNINLPVSHLKRFTIDLEDGTVRETQLSPHNIELPNINPAHLMHNYRFVYATGSERGFAQHIIKLDLSSKRHAQWQEHGAYPTEAVFVPRPGATEEDDGVVLSLILDAVNKKSFLLILDAKNLKEVARVYTPHAIPFTVHSKFFAK